MSDRPRTVAQADFLWTDIYEPAMNGAQADERIEQAQ
jgi:CheY-like chemotaxis protein